ncbi:MULTISPECIES: superoxide dismutase family protein [unclassified Maribacter]|uniref:superoxide dismutase family protein n=1 Tax=unclassified Maribacter TaxID=2615042 RepID=UPI000EDDA87D|nr:MULTISPECIES: superoxide dismutase family protein [unclassified Maribacter]HAI41990.1 superoxide dismutase [Maribacter sp.]|tara:strand:+ start:319437 stop:320030 length:594 start_codon:yes stop_codon:yes gene_type:complete
MKILKVELALLALLAVFSCKEVKKEASEAKEEMEELMDEAENEMTEQDTVVKFMLEPKNDSNVKGEVIFTEDDGEVDMVAVLSGLSEGEHAIHIHQTADCTAADGSSAGGHWNPTNEPHGKWGASEGYHKGDIGNFTADADGNAKVEFSTDEWCIGCDDENKNILGKGVIVHQGVDDYTSQPSGDAGARVSCAGIIE